MTESTGHARWDALRDEVDALDDQIVALLAQRTAVVTRIGQLKGEMNSDSAAVRSPDRVERVIARIRDLAEGHGMRPEIAERTYRALIVALTEMQLDSLQRDR